VTVSNTVPPRDHDLRSRRQTGPQSRGSTTWLQAAGASLTIPANGSSGTISIGIIGDTGDRTQLLRRFVVNLARRRAADRRWPGDLGTITTTTCRAGRRGDHRGLRDGCPRRAALRPGYTERPRSRPGCRPRGSSSAGIDDARGLDAEHARWAASQPVASGALTLDFASITGTTIYTAPRAVESVATFSGAIKSGRRLE